MPVGTFVEKMVQQASEDLLKQAELMPAVGVGPAPNHSHPLLVSLQLPGQDSLWLLEWGWSWTMVKARGSAPKAAFHFPTLPERPGVAAPAVPQ